MTIEEELEIGGRPCWTGVSIAAASVHGKTFAATKTFQNSEARAARILTARSTE
jgi:hypothetical protein